MAGSHPRVLSHRPLPDCRVRGAHYCHSRYKRDDPAHLCISIGCSAYHPMMHPHRCGTRDCHLTCHRCTASVSPGTATA